MSQRFAFAVIFSVLLIISCATINWAQESGARNIFDQQVGQKSDDHAGTKIQPRAQLPDRPKLKSLPSQSAAKPQHTARRAAPSKPPASTVPVALKYSVIMLDKKTPDGYQTSRSLTKVMAQEDGKFYGLADPDQTFVTNNVIRLVFEPSSTGYLYILSLETDGSRNLLFPEKGRSAQVESNKPVMLGPFRLEPPAGTDKLTVLFSRTPIREFEEGKPDLTKEFESELNRHDYRTIEEEEIYAHSDSKAGSKTALYFAARSEHGLKAEIDVKHKE